ncbi:MAG: transposase [Candidatus Marinimicrobia bacterium]|nr:transposase [Candidatus Neomarinimicrobiota bacterium]
MDKSIDAVGIDVAKATLSVCIHYTNDSEKALTIRNIDTDISIKLLPLLNNCKSKIVMESTGHYHWLVALLLSKNNYNVYVVNPILASQYTIKNIRKVKSDPADASGLARMARVADNLPKPFKSDHNALGMRKKLGLVASLTKQIQALKASITSVKEANKIIGIENSETIIELENNIKLLVKLKDKLEKECISISKQSEKVKKEMELLTSIPGISEFVATLSLHWFDRNNGSTAKSWIAYSGCDISVKESGT